MFSRKQRFIAVVLVAMFALTPAPVVFGASPSMPGVGTAVYPAPFLIAGQFGASKTGIISFRAPFNLRVLYVTMNVQAKGGTQGTSTLTCNNAANAFTNAVDLTGTAGTMLEATLVSAYQSVAKDTAISCDLVISGGSSPTLDNITAVIWYQRR